MGQELGNIRVNGPVQITGKDGLSVSMIPSSAAAVSKSDSTILAPGILFVGTAGDVVVRMFNGKNLVTFKNIPNGTWLPILVDKVMAATGASDILICY